MVELTGVRGALRGTPESESEKKEKRKRKGKKRKENGGGKRKGERKATTTNERLGSAYALFLAWRLARR